MGKKGKKVRGRQGEVNRRRGRCCASDACARIIILMRFTKSGTKCRGRGGGFGEYLTTQKRETKGD